ncbi:hypothetical protein [Alkalicoccobacillus porphyridii]|uniref:Uncharacterized protein n=1 Tax=Alkalicoccobacillus porphyridii TaxID=2597270 RepID=A0A553ZVQ2_9BACI|nr:hypothetical protein [Alkalicoccobacillus porphyridii]TSB45558.1 hypothetical protein FN960_15425 [Alkalicoccobacillus porphyridii]
MRKLLISVSTVVILSACNPFNSCTSPLPEEMPDDFEFSLQYGYSMSNELNTFENTFTKDLIADGTDTTEMVLSEEERMFIYGKLRSVDLWALPTETGTPCYEPHESYHLTMIADGEETNLEWKTSCSAKKLNQWKRVMNEIEDDIIHVRQEYQELPEASGGYD